MNNEKQRLPLRGSCREATDEVQLKNTSSTANAVPLPLEGEGFGFTGKRRKA
jgi:hypothetical protein